MAKRTSHLQARSSKLLKSSDKVYRCKLKIENELGLHARAAALFVKMANRHSAEVTLKKGEKTVNGKSIMGLLMLAAAKGSSIELSTSGEDSPEALENLKDLVESKFGET
jgi:phosphocarrier protein HPr